MRISCLSWLSFCCCKQEEDQYAPLNDREKNSNRDYRTILVSSDGMQVSENEVQRQQRDPLLGALRLQSGSLFVQVHAPAADSVLKQQGLPDSREGQAKSASPPSSPVARELSVQSAPSTFDVRQASHLDVSEADAEKD